MDWPFPACRIWKRCAGADRRGVPARDRLPRKGAEASMSNLVEIRDLNIRFTGERTVHAVNDLSLVLGEGEVLGLLGESGSGKSVTLRALMRLLPKKRTQISGSIQVLGRDVLALDDEDLSAFRGQTVSMIFQELVFFSSRRRHTRLVSDWSSDVCSSD